MSEIKFQKDKKGNVEQVIIKNATLYYTNIRNPRPIFDDRNLSYDKARKEYSVEVAVTEDDADNWSEIFTKQPAKKLTNKAFMEKYKLEDESELPFPDQKKQYTIKIVQKAQKKDGDPIGENLIPRVFVVEDGKAKDITFDTNVGNGSKGSVKVRANANDYGTFAYLSMVKVDELVEYEGGGGISEDDKEFLGVDEVELAEAPERTGSAATEDSEDNAEGGDDELDDDDF